MNKLLRLLLTLGAIAGIVWLLRDKIVPPPQPPVAHPPSFRSPPPPPPSQSEPETETVAAAVQAVDETPTDEAAAAEAPSDEVPSDEVPSEGSPAEDLEAVKGIGPVYKSRLAEIGITTFAELIGADAVTVAERLEVPEHEVRDWIDQAGELS